MPRPYTDKQLLARNYELDSTKTFLGPDGKPYPRAVVKNLEKLLTECVQGSPPSAAGSPEDTQDTLEESSVPPSSFDGDTSVERLSLCDCDWVQG